MSGTQNLQEIDCQREDERDASVVSSSFSESSKGVFNWVTPLGGTYEAEGQRLGALMDKVDFSVTRAANHPKYGEVVRLTGKDKKGNQYDLLLAPGRDWMCVEFKKKDKEAAMDMATQVLQMDRKNDVWLPTRVSNRYTIMEDGKEEIWKEFVQDAKILQVNSVPDSLFEHRKLREGTNVHSSDTLEEYKVKEGKLVPKPRPLLSRENVLTWVFIGAATLLLVVGLMKFIKKPPTASPQV